FTGCGQSGQYRQNSVKNGVHKSEYASQDDTSTEHAWDSRIGLRRAHGEWIQAAPLEDDVNAHGSRQLRCYDRPCHAVVRKPRCEYYRQKNVQYQRRDRDSLKLALQSKYQQPLKSKHVHQAISGARKPKICRTPSEGANPWPRMMG